MTSRVAVDGLISPLWDSLQTMKACILTEYGSPDFFEQRELSTPQPKDNEVLLKIHASSINSWDWEILMGKPFANRLMVGLRKPTKIKILGCDVAGSVAAVGSKVLQFKVGDEVFGDLSHSRWGGFAEYVCIPADKNLLALKPSNLSYEQSAAVPQAAVLALQGLRKGNIQQAKKVLINGASGGVGSFAVAMAKSYGVEVTGVCRTQKMEFVSKLGADRVIDYTRDNFTKNGQQYDLILDVQGHHTIYDYKRALTPTGRYVMVGGSSKLIRQMFFIAPWLSLVGSQKISLLLHKPNADDLEKVKDLIENESIKPEVDKTYALSEIPEAFRYYGEGHFKGKIVIRISND